jgi:hypothetical protein
MKSAWQDLTHTGNVVRFAKWTRHALLPILNRP